MPRVTYLPGFDLHASLISFFFFKTRCLPPLGQKEYTSEVVCQGINNETVQTVVYENFKFFDLEYDCLLQFNFMGEYSKK